MFSTDFIYISFLIIKFYTNYQLYKGVCTFVLQYILISNFMKFCCQFWLWQYTLHIISLSYVLDVLECLFPFEWTTASWKSYWLMCAISVAGITCFYIFYRNSFSQAWAECLDNVWFEQDSATTYVAIQSVGISHKMFGTMLWSERSPDLSI